MIEFKINPNLHIGNVTEITGTSIKVSLNRTNNELVQTFNGSVYHIGKVGSLIKLHTGPTVLIASVKQLHLSSPTESLLSNESDSTEIREIGAELIGEARYQSSREDLEDSLRFIRGISNYPLLHQGVYLVTISEENRIYEELAGGDRSNQIEIGTYTNNIACKINMDKLFGQHFVVLGTTGTGKSTAVAGIIHKVLEQPLLRKELLEQKFDKTGSLQNTPNSGNPEIFPRIVLIDTNGEYLTAFGNRATVFKLNDDKVESGSNNSLKLPYWLMSCKELQKFLCSNIGLGTNSCEQIIYKALKHARMYQLGMVSSASNVNRERYKKKLPDRIIRRKTTNQSEIDKFNIDRPIPFDLDEFSNHIRICQNYKNIENGWERLTEIEFQLQLAPILENISRLRNDNRFAFVMQNYEHVDGDISDIMAQFVEKIGGNSNNSVRIVDISGLPNDLVNLLNVMLAKLVFLYKSNQASDERKKDPILLVYDEAHRYFKNEDDTQDSEIQEAIRKIAREGRKYGIGLGLVTHRPTDLDSVVLSQCGTWLILRLTNSNDQEQVAKFLPDSMSDLSKVLSSLPRQEALLVGEAAPLPSRIKLNTLQEDKRPISHDLSFSKGWKTE